MYLHIKRIEWDTYMLSERWLMYVLLLESQGNVVTLLVNQTVYSVQVYYTNEWRGVWKPSFLVFSRDHNIWFLLTLSCKRSMNSKRCKIPWNSSFELKDFLGIDQRGTFFSHAGISSSKLKFTLYPKKISEQDTWFFMRQFPNSLFCD